MNNKSQQPMMSNKTMIGMLFVMIIMFAVAGFRQQIGGALDFIFQAIAFDGKYPVLTLVIAGTIMITMGTVIRSFMQNPIEMARTQQIQSDFQKEMRQARIENNLFKMKKLQEKYKNDKESLTRETMQLYRTYKVNPMGGCLPILIQLPVFVALYQALLNCIELRHASFIPYIPGTDIIWLADLSVKDPFYITPLVMGATMFLQQWLSPAMGDPQQRKIMMIMPVVFTVMFINFPSGLVVYWLCNNILSIIQQSWTLRKTK